MTTTNTILAEKRAELTASAAMYLREVERARSRFRRRNREIHDATAARLAELARGAEGES